ncbi:MAG: dockerin type I repeat-containing protein [Clostridia bacterium]|nr:dockerin type I repeat-containing protein [Clostridia bacterium]
MKKMIAVLSALSMTLGMTVCANAADYLGDVDKNGSVNSSDALTVLNYAVGLEKEVDTKLADINKDGQINSSDALDILKTAVGMLDPQTVEDEPELKNKAQIVEYFNKAVNGVIDEKAGYTKTRTATLNNLEGAEALMKIKVAADAVNEFLGVGEKSYTNEKGKAEYLSRAALTEADVKSCVCKLENGEYTITLDLADGASSAPNGSDTSPLQRCGVLSAETISTDLDYLSSDNIYTGVNGSGQATVQSVKMTTANTKVVVKINAETGKLISYDCNWKWNAELNKVKYSILTVSGKGKAESSVSIKNIQW